MTLNRGAQRFLNQTAPRLSRGFINIKSARHFLFGNERLQHRVPNLLGKNARQIIKLFQTLELSVVSSQLDDRFPAHVLFKVAQDKRAMLTMTYVRRI